MCDCKHHSNCSRVRHREAESGLWFTGLVPESKYPVLWSLVVNEQRIRRHRLRQSKLCYNWMRIWFFLAIIDCFLVIHWTDISQSVAQLIAHIKQLTKRHVSQVAKCGPPKWHRVTQAISSVPSLCLIDGQCVRTVFGRRETRRKLFQSTRLLKRHLTYG